MLGIKVGNMLEICERCPGCGIQHPCGEKTCKHDFAFAVEDEQADGTVLARFFLIGDRRICWQHIVAYAWMGWVPEEIISLYDEWLDQKYGGDYRGEEDYD